MEKKLKKETEAGAFYKAQNYEIAAAGATDPAVRAEIPEADGLLHILTGGALSMTLNGEAVTIDSAGEHKISCPKESTLVIGDGSLIGIYRFDGTITSSFKGRSELIFINNTSVVINGFEFFYQCYSLENLDGTVLKLTSYPVYYGTFRNTRVRMAPHIANTSKAINMNGFFQDNENLVSVPLIDTSNVYTTVDMFYGCSNLSSVPLYDLSKVTDMRNMFRGCTTIKSLPAFDFSNVTDAGCAFLSMDSLREFPAGFNFNKLIKGVFAFAGGRGLWIEQTDTYRTGGLFRFPEYSFPVCTTLMYAWTDQSALCVIGKLTIPECTDLTGAFNGCYNLRHVYGFTGLKCDINMSHCTKLTKDSMIYIMTEAADVTSIGPRTMTFGAANLAKLWDVNKAIAIEKGWTLL